MRFESSSQPAGKTVSLPEYGANMKAGQRDIYYLAAPRFGFYALNFLPILWREKLTQKWPKSNAEQFAKLQFLNDKIDQNTNFAKLPVAKYKFTDYFKLLSF